MKRVAGILLAAACAMTVSAQPAAFDHCARDAGTPLDVPAPGSYAIWVWGLAKVPARVWVAGQRYDAEPAPLAEGAAYGWAKAGAVDLGAGPAPVELGRGVAAIALSADPGFDAAARQRQTTVFADPEAAGDARAGRVRHTDTVFMMPAFAEREAWEPLAERLRRRILLSSGLYPLPERTPLNAQVSDRVDRGDYTVEKARFEAYPGFLVTGNLYRPKGAGPFPAIINPHGHWEHGRLEDSDVGSVPARCITFARMGIVAFSYDMVGYNDSKQFKQHRWADAREKLYGIHPFGLQLWSSIRALDFVASLPEVDPERLGCTGASGGGTQTFAASAVDPRIKACAPVNMISSTMQGGCICENAPLVRLENSNMEVGALMAPRPMIMVSATGDWTRETPRVEYPAIRSIYALYGAQDLVSNVHVDAGHNYNRASREAVYRFFGQWLLRDGNDYSAYTEPPYTKEPDGALRVFPGDKPPAGYPEGGAVVEQIVAGARSKWARFAQAHPDEVTPQLLTDVIGAAPPAVNDLDCERLGTQQGNGHVIERWVLGRRSEGDRIPALFYRGADAAAQDAVLLVHGRGKAALHTPAGPGPEIRRALDAGKAVLAIDAFLLGEHQSPFEATERKKVGAFEDTFMPTDTGYRIQDVLTAMTFLRARRDLGGRIEVHGIEDGGLWALFASAIDARAGRTVIDTSTFLPDSDADWVERFYIPCIQSIGGVTTAIRLIAPRELVLDNPARDPAWAAYASATL